jgi:hypothetical protein
MRLGPLRETCVQPAPKSRFVVFGLFVYEDQEQINSFPAEAGPTGVRAAFRRTGFSREGAGVCDASFSVWRQIVPALRVVVKPWTLRVPQARNLFWAS